MLACTAQAAQLARGLGMIACWIAVAWSRCVAAVLRWLLLSATFTLVHGSLRVGSAAGALQPGVPLAAVLSLDDGRRVTLPPWRRRNELRRSKSNLAVQAASIGRWHRRIFEAVAAGPTCWQVARRDHRDPRRVFRELWHVVDGYSRFAVLTAVDYVSFQYVATRHWLRMRLEKGVRMRPPSQFLY